MSNAQTLAFSFVGFTVIASMTLFFSSHPRLFIKVFVPPEEYRNAIRSFVRDPNFCKGMRFMARLQFAVGALIGMTAIWIWFISKPANQ